MSHKRSAIAACLTAWIVCAGCTPEGAQGAADVAAIRELATRWERAWNRHDMRALVQVLTDDADFVNVGARHWKGRDDIGAEHAARLPQFSDSVWTTNEVSVQLLTKDMALVHVAWSMRGDKDPDGTPRPPRDGLFTWLVVRLGNDWRVRAAHNTNRGTLPSPRGKS